MAAYAVNGLTVLEGGQKAKPGVVILDVNPSLFHGIAAGLELKESLPHTNVIVLTMSADCEVVGDALRYLPFITLAAPELVQAIYRALEAKAYAPPKSLHDRFLRDRRPHVTRTLTPRQREVLRLLAEGRAMKEIAATLKVAIRTVAFHKYQIMDKFGLRNNIDLIRLAIKERLIDAGY